MKRYDTNEVSILIGARFVSDHASISIQFHDGNGRSEKLISVPSEIIKKKINDTVFVKYVLDFFIKE